MAAAGGVVVAAGGAVVAAAGGVVVAAGGAVAAGAAVCAGGDAPSVEGAAGVAVAAGGEGVAALATASAGFVSAGAFCASVCGAAAAEGAAGAVVAAEGVVGNPPVAACAVGVAAVAGVDCAPTREAEADNATTATVAAATRMKAGVGINLAPSMRDAAPSGIEEFVTTAGTAWQFHAHAVGSTRDAMSPDSLATIDGLPAPQTSNGLFSKGISATRAQRSLFRRI